MQAVKPLDFNFARRTFDLDTLARVVVHRFARDLQRRINRRDLADGSAKFWENTIDVRLRNGDFIARHDFAFDIAGRGGESKLQSGQITLIALETEGRKLGRFAQANQQQPRGERIKRAGVASFFGAE